MPVRDGAGRGGHRPARGVGFCVTFPVIQAAPEIPLALASWNRPWRPRGAAIIVFAQRHENKTGCDPLF